MVLVQTESEKRMHRVLYLLRFLRATILHYVFFVALVFMNVGLGISGLYSPVDQYIDTMKLFLAALSDYYIHFFLVAVVVFATAFFVILYFSIIHVWKWALRMLVVATIVIMVANAFVYIAQVSFVVELGLVFAGLYFFALAITTWVFLDIAIGLWSVAGTPEVSAFRATLDSRLTRGLWGLLNKALDLPRTPLQSWPALAAYGLSLVGMLGLAESLSYLLTFGNILSKTSAYSLTCPVDGMEQCMDRSESAAFETLLWLALSVMGIKLSLALHANAKKLSASSVRDILKNSGKRYILYLRSFGSDDIRLPRPRLPLISRIMAPSRFKSLAEEEFFDVVDGYMPLIAIGRPGDGQETAVGVAYREYLPDDSWKAYITDKVVQADKIVLVLNTTEGVLWELSFLLGMGASSKALFFFDPRAKNKGTWLRIKDAIIPIFARFGVLPPDFSFHGNAIAFFFSKGTLVEIENSNWSVSSYRTALSTFLTHGLK
ncbi:MAG: hypothetical protein AB7U95_24635 [Reyranella sp.]